MPDFLIVDLRAQTGIQITTACMGTKFLTKSTCRQVHWRKVKKLFENGDVPLLHSLCVNSNIQLPLYSIEKNAYSRLYITDKKSCKL
jgi:hypothetical protein